MVRTNRSWPSNLDPMLENNHDGHTCRNTQIIVTKIWKGKNWINWKKKPKNVQAFNNKCSQEKMSMWRLDSQNPPYLLYMLIIGAGNTLYPIISHLFSWTPHWRGVGACTSTLPPFSGEGCKAACGGRWNLNLSTYSGSHPNKTTSPVQPTCDVQQNS
jgi:hypothetical protein